MMPVIGVILMALGALGIVSALMLFSERSTLWSIPVGVIAIALVIVGASLIDRNQKENDSDYKIENQTKIDQCLAKGGFPKLDNDWRNTFLFCYTGKVVIPGG